MAPTPTSHNILLKSGIEVVRKVFALEFKVRRSRPADAKVPAAASQVTGATMICVGISMLAMWGFGGGPKPWLDVAAFVLVVVGAGISGVLSKQTFR